jgi:hypothetical protein
MVDIYIYEDIRLRDWFVLISLLMLVPGCIRRLRITFLVWVARSLSSQRLVQFSSIS